MANNTTTTAAPATNNTAIPTATPQTPAQTLSFREKLDAGDNHWLWKLSLRVALLVFAVISTGCLGWAAQTAYSTTLYWFYGGQWLLWWTFITSSLTIVWCLVCILVFLLRRPSRPVHPGVAVGIDLVLWIAYWFTTVCAAAAAASVLSVGSDGTIDSSDGYYTMASNGTWVHNLSSYRAQNGQERSCSNYIKGDNESMFATCADQDAWVNAMWKATRTRAGVELTGAVCQGLCLLLHFVLFVWACVDTHRRNKGKTSVDAEKLAADIVVKMVRDGAILQAPGAHQQHQQQQQHGYQAQGQNQQYRPYTVHQGPPPPLLNPQHAGLGGPAPAHQPIVEHYGNEKGGVASHAI